MDKRQSKPVRPNGGDVARQASSILEGDSVLDGLGVIPTNEPPIDAHDDFSDLRDIDFSQYIADSNDNAGSMNSPSSPSVGMMSKTPFKTPAPSEFADDPIELVSSPVRPLKLRDYLPGLGSSVEPSFAMDDSQQTKVIAKAALVPKGPANPQPQPQYSYALSVSSDEGDGPSNAETCKLPGIGPDSPAAEVAAPAKRKKATRAKRASPAKASPPKVPPPKRNTRNKKINGRKKPETSQDDSPATRNPKGAAGKKSLEATQDDVLAVGHMQVENEKKKPGIIQNDIPAEGDTVDATPPKRPLLARMLSVLSEPGSLKWEDPLVGGHLQGSAESDECPRALSLSSPSSTVMQATVVTAQKGTTAQILDDSGSNYSPSIPASFADPSELSHSLASERSRNALVGPKKNRISPDPDPIDRTRLRGSLSKSPVKGPRNSRVSPGKRGSETLNTTAPSKRRRVQEKVKKRVVQPRSKVKKAQARVGSEDEFGVPVADMHQPQHTIVADVLLTNSSKVKGANSLETEHEVAGSANDKQEPEHAVITDVPCMKRTKAKDMYEHNKMEDEVAAPVVNTHEPENTVIAGVPRANSRTVVSETGSPTRIDLTCDNTSDADDGTNSLVTVEKKAGADSSKATVSTTQTPMRFKAAFQPQVLRPRMQPAQVDSPQAKQELVTNHPGAGSRLQSSRKSPLQMSGLGSMPIKGKNAPRDVLKHLQPHQQNLAVAQKSPSKPNDVEKMEHKGESVPHVLRNALSNVEPAHTSQLNPAYEAFRQHILGQLTTIEARQQHDKALDANDGPTGPEMGTFKLLSMNIVPQHMLGGVLNVVTEKTLEHIKAKERDLESIAREYQSGVAAFIDKVENLHQAENVQMIRSLRKQRKSFVESCEVGARNCEGLMEKLEQCALSGRGSDGLEEWLRQGREMQKQLRGA